MQSRTGPVQGQKRNFPVKFSHTGKNIFSLQGTPFLITGISLWKKLHKENPVFITGKGFGINFFQWPHNKKGFSVCIYIYLGVSPSSGFKVAWSLQFLGYLRTLSLQFQKARILLVAFCNFKLKVLKYPRNCRLHANLILKVFKKSWIG